MWSTQSPRRLLTIRKQPWIFTSQDLNQTLDAVLFCLSRLPFLKTLLLFLPWPIMYWYCFPTCVSFLFSCHSLKVSLFWLPSAYLWFNYKFCLDTVLNLFLIYDGILYHNGRTLPTKSQNKEHMEIAVVIITRAKKFPDCFNTLGRAPQPPSPCCELQTWFFSPMT